MLPHIRSSKGSSYRAVPEAGGDIFPTTEQDAFSLPKNIPSELFVDGTFEDHMRDSLCMLESHSAEAQLSRKALSNGPTYKETWGFVMQDLEKKGYNKDVGNRGDILHHLNPSKSSTSNLATNVGTTLTNSAPNATIIPNNVSNNNNYYYSDARKGSKMTGGGGALGEGEMMPELIPSTVQTMQQRDASRAVGRLGLSITDAMKQLDMIDKNRQTTGISGGGSSTSRQKSDDLCHHRAGGDKYKINNRYSSEGTDKQRNSVYDNLSYGGFETARQDTDEDEDDLVRKRAKGGGGSGARTTAVAAATTNNSGGGGGGPSSNLSISSNNSSSRYINAQDTSLAANGRPLPPTTSTITINNNTKLSTTNNGVVTGINNSNKRSPLSNLSSKFQQHAPTKDTLDSGSNISCKGKSGDNNGTAGGAGGGSKGAWSCVYCTFSNEPECNVCEMCSRSRQPAGAPAIKPLVAGGRQCEQCTLINDKDSNTCSACGITLEACPTYI